MTQNEEEKKQFSGELFEASPPCSNLLLPIIITWSYAVFDSSFSIIEPIADQSVY